MDEAEKQALKAVVEKGFCPFCGSRLSWVRVGRAKTVMECPRGHRPEST